MSDYRGNRKRQKDPHEPIFNDFEPHLNKTLSQFFDARKKREQKKKAIQNSMISTSTVLLSKYPLKYAPV